MKVGDLVKMPKATAYWWSEQIGIVDRCETESYVEYRVFVPGKGYARFGDPEWVELISESR